MNAIPGRSKALATLALCGTLLSFISYLDTRFHWNLCQSSACVDPRWKEYGDVFHVPIALLGGIAYTIAALLLTTYRMHLTPLRFLTGFIAGCHAYLFWIQAFVIHAICLICVSIGFIGFVLFMSVVCVSKTPRSSLGVSLCGITIAILFFGIAQRHIEPATAPDPLVRGTSPSIYRPEAVVNAPMSIVDNIRASKSVSMSEALVHMDIFIDFQCPTCAKLDALIPQIMEGRSRISVTYRVFILEGHPLGWQAAILALCAGSKGQFLAAKDQLFLHQANWVQSGNPAEVLQNITGKVDLSADTVNAAKSSIREDVALGATFNVNSSPCIVLTNLKSGRRVVLLGLHELDYYKQALQGISE